MNRPRLVRYAASAAILAAFVFLVEHWIGWARLLRPWLSVPPAAVGAAALLFAGSYVLRALRVFDYFRDEMRGAFALCLKLALTHNLLNHLLPMRAGELGFPLLMSRWFGIGGVRSVSVLLWFRLLDAHTLAGFAIAAWFWPAALPWFALPSPPRCSATPPASSQSTASPAPAHMKPAWSPASLSPPPSPPAPPSPPR